MKYVIEWDLIPCGERKVPMTRRKVIEAEYIEEAITLAVEDIYPGSDCVSFRVHEVTDE